MPYSEYETQSPDCDVDLDTPPEELYRLGLIYSTGLGVPIDYIAAHKWFNLAASHGLSSARDSRSSIAEIMSMADIRAAQRAAREWMSVQGTAHGRNFSAIQA